MVKTVLGDTPEVAAYMKYRQLHKSYPRDVTFKQSYDTAQAAQVQTSISAAHSLLRAPNEKDKRKIAAKLLNHWGVYTY